MIYFIKINLLTDMKNIPLFLLVHICQLAFLIVLCFTYSGVMSILSGTYGQGDYVITTADSLTRAECEMKIDVLDDYDNYFIYLSDDIIASYKDYSIVRKGRNIQNAGEILVPDENKYKVGDNVNLFSKNFLVVGIVLSGKYELNISDVPKDFAVSDLTIINTRLLSKTKKNVFIEKISRLFIGAQVQVPTKLSLAQILSGSDYFKLLIGIIALSLLSTLLSYSYIYNGRKENYKIFMLYGASNAKMYINAIAEQGLFSLIKSIISTSLYVIFDLTVAKKIFSLAFGSYFRLTIYDYFVINALFIGLMILSMLFCLYRQKRKICRGNVICLN